MEIERKFLVKSEAWRGLAEGVRFRQGYLQTHPCTVRVRTEGERGVLTIKGQTRGFSREEFEYEIPRGDADRMLDTLALPSLIDKIRYKIPYQGFVWEVDEFLGDNAGLSSLKSNFPTRGKPLSGPAGLGKR
ncbi:MAG: CYTH domain-containing protein [Bilophila wadsworthia]